MADQARITKKVAGLAAPVTISIDRFGIPHIAAQTIEDAFFGQGYAAAWMRLWQLDINHRRQLGRLAEVFGPDFVPFDHVARLLTYRGPLEAEWQALDPRVQPIAHAFAAGINARIAEIEADPSLLPPEFIALDMMPDRWTAEDLVRGRMSISPNIRGEIRRAALACRGLLAADSLVQPLEPDWPLTLPAGLDPCAITAEDLKFLEYRSAPLPFAKIPRRDRQGSIELSTDIDARNGSNAWVIGPAHTTTGRPILANDPHLPFSIPSPRMITHLTAPGLNVIGAGPVFRPGVQFGHNDTIAFGRTDFQIDQEDLYLLALDADGTHHAGPAGPEKIERLTDTIRVRGQDAVIVELAYSARGPIILEDRAKHRAVALRAAWMDAGAPTNLEYVPKIFARNWDEFRAAIRYAVWGTNYMYADIAGNIGWQSAGRVPVRPNHDGLLPVPAARDYPWTGILPLDQMPGEFNPARGWIASANQMPFPADWQVAARCISFEWIANDRHRRIVDLMPQGKPHSPEDSWHLQEDVFSRRAHALVAVLAQVKAAGADAERAQLGAWDCEIRADSRTAALYEFWASTLQRDLRAVLVPKQATDLITTLHPHVVIAALQSPDARFGADPIAARDALMLRALTDAARQLQARAQPGQPAPTWGALHDVTLAHSLAERFPAATRAAAGVSGHGSSGDGATVFARWWASLSNTHVSGGASFRAVVDVGNWEAARAVMGPGQSGNPDDPHYRDLYALWLDNGHFPLTFDPEAAAAASELQIHLEPHPPGNTP
jgi:penicillin amidase